MKVTGFSFVKNAIIYDYPVVESILSVLPICDEFVITVGKSDDDTLGLIKSIDSDKIIIHETVWDESLRKGGRVLAKETDKAFALVSADSDWAFYIQADEVVHEDDLTTIKTAMEKHKDNPKVDGLLFKYHHFFGSYDYIGASSAWYKNEIRVIKNDKSIYSFRDAQGFKKGKNKFLRVVPVDAYIYHYGWVRPPKVMLEKQTNFAKLWHDENKVEQEKNEGEVYDYTEKVNELTRFEGSHPKIMKQRINSKNWSFDLEDLVYKKNMKDKFKDFMKRNFNIHVGYKNYKIVKF